MSEIQVLDRNNGSSAGVIRPRLMDRDAARVLCGGLCPNAFDKLVKSDQFGPERIKLGGRVFFVTEELEDWIKASCPDRATWKAMQLAKA